MATDILEIHETSRQHALEIEKGERFEFGKNWSGFLAHLDEARIQKAEDSLRSMLDVDDLEGKSFLDIGSGSGLFSLAARRLGAKVVSFDYDSNSYACTLELKRRFFEGDEKWDILQGSALDREFVAGLGKFDFVYSWGVLHHTGEMWKGLENTDLAVAAGGKLFIAIYNDTGSQAKRWRRIKKIYCRLPRFLQTPYAFVVIVPDEISIMMNFLVEGKPFGYINYCKNYRNERGMNRWHDIVDWVGGFPYEVASPDEIFDFYKSKSYYLTKIKCRNVGLGCNEFVFEKN